MRFIKLTQLVIFSKHTVKKETYINPEYLISMIANCDKSTFVSMVGEEKSFLVLHTPEEIMEMIIKRGSLSYD